MKHDCENETTYHLSREYYGGNINSCRLVKDYSAVINLKFTESKSVNLLERQMQYELVLPFRHPIDKDIFSSLFFI